MLLHKKQQEAGKHGCRVWFDLGNCLAVPTSAMRSRAGKLWSQNQVKKLRLISEFFRPWANGSWPRHQRMGVEWDIIQPGNDGETDRHVSKCNLYLRFLPTHPILLPIFHTRGTTLELLYNDLIQEVGVAVEIELDFVAWLCTGVILNLAYHRKTESEG